MAASTNSPRRPVVQPGKLGEEIARLYVKERFSANEISVRVGLAKSMVLRYLDGMGVVRRENRAAIDLARALAQPAQHTCVLPGCSSPRMITSRGYRLAACSYHTKLVLGLIESV